MSAWPDWNAVNANAQTAADIKKPFIGSSVLWRLRLRRPFVYSQGGFGCARAIARAASPLARSHHNERANAMAAHGKHVGAVRVERSDNLVELVHRSHRLLINFFDGIPRCNSGKSAASTTTPWTPVGRSRRLAKSGVNSLTRMEPNGFALLSLSS